jgi:nicotinamidase-related amidase
VIARCGLVHPFAELRARQTALVVMDLQNAFLNEAIGYPVCPAGCGIVPKVNRIAGALHEAGGGAFRVMDTFDPDAAEEWRSLHAMLTPEARARREAAVAEGSVG